jgi:hypothetical protein
MFFLGLTFLITASREIKFITATVLEIWKKQTIFAALQQVISIRIQQAE